MLSTSPVWFTVLVSRNTPCSLWRQKCRGSLEKKVLFLYLHFGKLQHRSERSLPSVCNNLNASNNNAFLPLPGIRYELRQYNIFPLSSLNFGPGSVNIETSNKTATTHTEHTPILSLIKETPNVSDKCGRRFRRCEFLIT